MAFGKCMLIIDIPVIAMQLQIKKQLGTLLIRSQETIKDFTYLSYSLSYDGKSYK